MATVKKDKPYTVHEQALTMLKNSVDNVMHCIGDIASVAIVVGWRGELTEVPAGVVVTPDNIVDVAQLSHMVTQLTRMIGFVLGQLDQFAQQQRRLAEQERQSREQTKEGQVRPDAAGST